MQNQVTMRSQLMPCKAGAGVVDAEEHQVALVSSETEGQPEGQAPKDKKGQKALKEGLGLQEQTEHVL